MSTLAQDLFRETRLQRMLVSLAGFSLLALTPSFLPAQANPSAEEEGIEELQAFEVTGSFAGSLAAAAEVKRSNKLIIEAVAAEDIGKLPDVSIADSLTRLPGLTTQRLNGRAQAIVIRGMNGDYTTGLLNGREQVSAGANRAVEFDQYPAELLNGVIVYKTTDASLVGQGLAGTIDLRTIRPLDQAERSIAANFFYEWTEMEALNSGAKDYGTRYTLSYVDQFNDDKVGFAFGYSNSNRPGQGEQWNAWGFPNAFYDSNLPFVLGGAKPFVRSSELERAGYMGVLELAPNQNFHATIDLYYSNFDESQLLRGIEIPLQWSSAVLQPGYTAEDNLITRGTFNNVYGVMRNDIVTRDADVLAGGINLEFGDKEGLHFEVDLSHSKIERKDFVLETYSGFASNQGAGGFGTPDTVTYVLGEGEGGAKFQTTLNYGDKNAIRLAGPQGWGAPTIPNGQVGFLKGPLAEDELTQLRLNAKRDFTGIINRVEVGAAYTERSKFEFEAGPGGTEGYFLGLKAGNTAPLPAETGLTDLSFIGIPQMVSYDPLAAYSSGIYNFVANSNPAYVSNNWEVDEKILLGYVQLDLEHQLGEIPVSGNVGFQVIQSDQAATGLSANGTSTTPVEGEHDYVDFVPSLNLNFDFGSGRNLRFSASRQLMRQRMADMRAGQTYSFDSNKAGSTDPLNSPWSGGGGNPELEPWRSNSFDLSFENYFADGLGYWAVAAFYKDLVSYTYNQPQLFDFVGLPSGSTSVPVITQGLVTIPQNGQGGSIKGLEFTLSLPGEKFTPVLKGFGFVGSASFFDSSIQPDLNNPATPIVGLSDTVASGTLYYERSGFAARFSTRYRSEYRGDIATFGPRGEVFRNLQPETIYDAQISYTFQEGRFRNLAFIAQGYNLSDEPLFAASGDDERYVQDYQRYGASYSIGVSYKY